MTDQQDPLSLIPELQQLAKQRWGSLLAAEFGEPSLALWQYHLQQLVISPAPLDYLADNT